MAPRPDPTDDDVLELLDQVTHLAEAFDLPDHLERRSYPSERELPAVLRTRATRAA